MNKHSAVFFCTGAVFVALLAALLISSLHFFLYDSREDRPAVKLNEATASVDGAVTDVTLPHIFSGL